MTKNQNVNFSDVDHAREITHRLRGKYTSEEAKKPQPGCLNYIKFSGSPYQKQGSPRINFDFGEINSFGSDTWEKLLDWCTKIANAETAFLMDDVGLTIACQGKMSVDKTEVSGSRLMMAFEAGDRMEIGEETPCSLSFEFDTFWVTGIRLHSRPGTALMIGMISAAPVLEETRRAIEKTVKKVVSCQA